MSKPAGKCVFCGQQGNLTHGHIWPEWISEVMPFEDTHHVQLVGHLQTFRPRMRVPGFQRIVRQCHGTRRKPRNTCLHGGWMSQIESAAKPAMTRLMFGDGRGRPVALALTEGRSAITRVRRCCSTRFPERGNCSVIAVTTPTGSVPPWTRRASRPASPPRKTRKLPVAYDKELCKQRHKIEIMFDRDRCAHTFFSAVCIVAVVTFYLNQ